jgi:undecaprenyl-diphosphatase
MNTLQAILAIIEGITEFLPVSSTGHMIIASSFFGIASDDLFTIVIQLGAILSVVVYFKRFFQTWDFYFKLFVAFIPAVVLGLLFSDLIDELLESPVTVAVSLLLGGIVLLKVDQWFNHSEDTK